MQDIKIREEKMKEKRLHTSRRQFVMEICSRYPLVLYRNSGIISRFPETARTQKIVKSNAYEYNPKLLEYDKNLSFMENFMQMFLSSPKQALGHFMTNENVEYCDIAYGAKNAYLSFDVGDDSENVLYSDIVNSNCRNVLNSTFIVRNSQNIFFSNFVMEGFNIFYSRYITNCSDIWFSSNLVGCHNCILCDNLNNKSYYIANKEYSKEAYEIEKIQLLADKKKFVEYQKKANVMSVNYGTENSNGNALYYSENVENGYYAHNIKNARNIVFATGIEESKNIYDCIKSTVKCVDAYFSCFSGRANNVYGCINTGMVTNVYYSFLLENCSYCLGCIGLKNKEFCIFNRQYTKEERFEKANEIFAQMDKDGTLGQFFPGTMNPFYFNDTVAYLIDDSFAKEEVIKEGYLRRDEEIKVDVPAGAEVITTKALNNFQGFNERGEREINPEILKKVIKDEKGNIYRIIPMELEFLQKYGLPLPEIHRLERIKLGFKFK